MTSQNLFNKETDLLEDIIFRHINVARYRIFRNLPDDKYLERMFLFKMGHKLNLEKPESFSEKLQWLKLYNRRPEYIDMVDKYEAKKYLTNIIGSEHVIPALGVWNKFDDIDFDLLPNQFVLKCTHGWGSVIIVKDKSDFDVKYAKKDLEKDLRRNFFYSEREWVYKNIKPRIIAEPFMSNLEENLLDYKIYNFNGKAKVVVCENHSANILTQDFFDCDWNHLNVKKYECPNSPTVIEKPACFAEMLELSRILSKDLPFVRTDFYNINGKAYVGELTFYPSAGLRPYEPESFDYEMGSYLELPDCKYI